jgi:hypothetical protein
MLTQNLFGSMGHGGAPILSVEGLVIHNVLVLAHQLGPKLSQEVLGAKADGRWMLGSMCMIVLRKNVGL